MKITLGHKLITIKALRKFESEILVYAGELEDSTAQIFTIALKQPDKPLDEIMNREIEALVREFPDVFPEQ